MSRKLRMGMIGGGTGSFIGDVHRKAASIDGMIDFMTLTLDEAVELEKIVAKSGKLFALTHNYTGHPLVKQAKAMIAKGDLGNVRKVQVQYLQGWLSTAVEKTGQKQASWRVDPKKSGIGGALGDIGTHAENLLEYITGLKIDELAADLGSNDLYDEALNVSRIPAGHPEGYLEAFATIYKNFATHAMAVLEGKTIEKPDYPTAKDGVRGMKFIYAAVDSDKQNASWTKI